MMVWRAEHRSLRLFLLCCSLLGVQEVEKKDRLLGFQDPFWKVILN